MSKNIQIIKASGEKELFSREKVVNSLIRAGADLKLAESIASTVENKISDGATTKQIYNLAFSLLKKTKKRIAGKYSLKKAIFQLGPQGYPFEKFVAKLLESQGYETKVNQIIQGKCVSHEVDVVAKKDGKYFLIECKFHNQQGIKSDVKVALYIKARFDDIQLALKSEDKYIFSQPWLVTNTKFTQDALQYTSCVNMKAIGWNYPPKESLQSLIEKSGLHPITCLPSLSASQKNQVLNEGLVLCKELIERPDVLYKIGLRGSKQRQIIEEAKQVCSI